MSTPHRDGTGKGSQESASALFPAETIIIMSTPLNTTVAAQLPPITFFIVLFGTLVSRYFIQFRHRVCFNINRQFLGIGLWCYSGVL